MEDRPIVYTITQLSNGDCRIYTKDSRVKPGDDDLTVANSKLINTMIMISSLLNDEGYAVLFEVD